MFVALTTMVLVAYLLRDLITVETLVVTRWTPSDPNVRGWFINPFAGKVSVGAGFAAVGPALLVSEFVRGEEGEGEGEGGGGMGVSSFLSLHLLLPSFSFSPPSHSSLPLPPPPSPSSSHYTPLGGYSHLY